MKVFLLISFLLSGFVSADDAGDDEDYRWKKGYVLAKKAKATGVWRSKKSQYIFKKDRRCFYKKDGKKAESLGRWKENSKGEIYIRDVKSKKRYYLYFGFVKDGELFQDELCYTNKYVKVIKK